MHEARAMLNLAARVAVRAAGHVEPNPLVGCVLVRAGAEPIRDRIIGLGHHERFGQAHAEVNALRDAKARGLDPAGCTAYVTLEPCASTGKNPPCTDALIAARVARVVCARRDPNPAKAGGAAKLIAAGIACEFTDVSMAATRLSDPFVKRLSTGLPWVIAKWAQSIDGKVTTRAGESQWITGPRSRLRVHRLRARVDAIITGVGSIVADDSLLTARSVSVRRVATRVVLDPSLRIPINAKIVTTARSTSTLIVTRTEEGQSPHAESLRARGVSVMAAPTIEGGSLDLAWLLRHLASLGASTLMVEAGPATLGHFLAADLLDELHVYTGPIVIGDAGAPGPMSGPERLRLTEALKFELLDWRSIGPDTRAVYQRAIAP